MRKSYILAYVAVFAVLGSSVSVPAQVRKFEFSTLLGGSRADEGKPKIVVDRNRCIYLMGVTASNDFPVTSGAYLPTFSYTEKMFVTKLDPSGSSMIYSTFLDGSGRERPGGFAVDDEGNAYVAGTTGSVGYPRTPGSYLSEVRFDPQAWLDRVFLTKLDPSGSILVYSIVIGDEVQNVEGSFLGLDGHGHAYVVGYANSSEIETTPGALQVQCPDSIDVYSRPFIFKFSRDGSGLEYSTYFGGPTRGPLIQAFTVDRKGNAYLGGAMASEDFPLTENCYSSVPGGYGYTFLSKIDPSGSRLVFSTLIELLPHHLAVDDSENVHIAYGSQLFPVTPGAYNPDTFQSYGICKLSSGGNRLVFSTRTGESSGFVATDAAGRVYYGGNSYVGYHDPVTADAYDGCFNGGESDVYFAVFDPSGSNLLYATYLGGSGDDVCTGFTVTPSGDIYLAGVTKSPDFPTTDGALDRTLNGKSDYFICKFSFDSGPVSVEESPRMFRLNPARPNPFNPSTTISFTLPAPGKAELAVYSITGQKVRTLVSGPLSAGAHEVAWDGRDETGIPVSSGVYLSRLESGGMMATGKMLLVK